MATKGKVKVHLKGRSRYLPWPELHHAARSLFAVAREYPPGSAHVATAAVVLSAFAVEGFCQTVGPVILADTWLTGEKPDESLGIRAKLKKIGKASGVAVDYGKQPWKGVAELFAARNELAHAKPKLFEVSEMLTLQADEDPRFHLHEALRRKHRPLHDVDRLEALMKEIDAGLREIWAGAAMQPSNMNLMSGSQWSWSIAE